MPIEMKFTKQDRETTVSYKEGEPAILYSSIKRDIKRLMEVADWYEVLTEYNGVPTSIAASMDNSKQVSFRKKRVMTDEQRMQLSHMAKERFNT